MRLNSTPLTRAHRRIAKCQGTRQKLLRNCPAARADGSPSRQYKLCFEFESTIMLYIGHRLSCSAAVLNKFSARGSIARSLAKTNKSLLHGDGGMKYLAYNYSAKLPSTSVFKLLLLSLKKFTWPRFERKICRQALPLSCLTFKKKIRLFKPLD